MYVKYFHTSVDLVHYLRPLYAFTIIYNILTAHPVRWGLVHSQFQPLCAFNYLKDSHTCVVWFGLLIVLATIYS